jgi:hypothetical protein
MEAFAPEVAILTTYLRARMGVARRNEQGQSAVEWIIIIGVAASIALAVGAILYAKVKDKADNINLDGGS